MALQVGLKAMRDAVALIYVGGALDEPGFASILADYQTKEAMSELALAFATLFAFTFRQPLEASLQQPLVEVLQELGLKLAEREAAMQGPQLPLEDA